VSDEDVQLHHKLKAGLADAEALRAHYLRQQGEEHSEERAVEIQALEEKMGRLQKAIDDPGISRRRIFY